MNWKNDEEKTSAYFSLLYAKYGATPQALDWRAEKTQDNRFKVLAEIGNLQSTRILDVGCGFGHFLDWLRCNGIAGDYTGMDMTASMVKEARRAHPGETILHTSILEAEGLEPSSFDYVVASGIFYRQTTSPYTYMEQVVKRMFALCRKGVAFNTLSAWGLPPKDGEFLAQPETVIRMCQKITPRIIFRHDYHPGDFCIYLYKEAS